MQIIINVFIGIYLLIGLILYIIVLFKMDSYESELHIVWVLCCLFLVIELLWPFLLYQFAIQSKNK
ncbi:MAG: hypothetical protein K0S61_92 [Anaerocolumna sp.]|jgi:hypothetical protein|nr:hypothetical protein [Anaerocolumna sp.]